ncbi:hypothetical protein SmJEL517_g00334 [Synchytrium microbalum]|uniref:RBR-type E3 ubiquitin transferase n=1 Tax=Synchytrium microbalum TaxID=1806994 RepID=A0A507CFZ1_9FUNG|nr:uncharacterized protein SmJEL517_g00334 [Synchytrium microbalum]TPX38099.1 hypothetical protein SmJEL517_g00334 [Synchytrium microbalum]
MQAKKKAKVEVPKEMIGIDSDEEEEFADFDEDLDFDDEDQTFEALDEEEEANGLAHKKKMPLNKALYESRYMVHTPSGINNNMIKKEINQLVETLCLSLDVVACLFRNAGWKTERVLDAYADQGKAWDALLIKSGLSSLPDLSVSSLQIQEGDWRRGFVCGICGDDEPPKPNARVLSLVGCGHKFCQDCYKEYVTRKIADRELQFGCPGCKVVLCDSAIQQIAPECLDKLQQWQIRSFVDSKKKLKCCPAPDCTYVIEFQNMVAEISDPVLQMPRVPICCTLLVKWIKRCADDSETAKWITGNTKDCLKCHTAIEKNGGCHHMSCWKCGSHFCWNCYKDWHGYDKQCNKFDIDQHKAGQGVADASRASLQRYLHYFTRYTNDIAAVNLTAQAYEKIETKMTQLQIETSLSYIQVQFLRTAVDLLLKCRRTLAYSYVAAFYMKREKPIQTNQAQLFEDRQADLASAVDKLSELVENAGGEEWLGTSLEKKKIEVLDLTSYVKTRQEVLLIDFMEALLPQGRKSLRVPRALKALHIKTALPLASRRFKALSSSLLIRSRFLIYRDGRNALQNCWTLGFMKSPTCICHRTQQISSTDMESPAVINCPLENYQVQICKMLIDAGCDVQAGGGAALRAAVSFSHFNLADLLLEKGATPDVRVMKNRGLRVFRKLSRALRVDSGVSFRLPNLPGNNTPLNDTPAATTPPPQTPVEENVAPPAAIQTPPPQPLIVIAPPRPRRRTLAESGRGTLLLTAVKSKNLRVASLLLAPRPLPVISIPSRTSSLTQTSNLISPPPPPSAEIRAVRLPLATLQNALKLSLTNNDHEMAALLLTSGALPTAGMVHELLARAQTWRISMGYTERFTELLTRLIPEMPDREWQRIELPAVRTVCEIGSVPVIKTIFEDRHIDVDMHSGICLYASVYSGNSQATAYLVHEAGANVDYFTWSRILFCVGLAFIETLAMGMFGILAGIWAAGLIAGIRGTGSSLLGFADAPSASDGAADVTTPATSIGTTILELTAMTIPSLIALIV